MYIKETILNKMSEKRQKKAEKRKASGSPGNGISHDIPAQIPMNP